MRDRGMDRRRRRRRPRTLAHAAPPDVIRTGGPSDARDAKRAVVLSSRSLVGRSFTVTSASGRVVLRGRLRRARGSARPWRRAAVADLSAVRAPGTYRVRVAGRTASWVVVRDGEASRRAIANILSFLAVNADGAEPSPAHGPSHLNDAVIAGRGAGGSHRRVDGRGRHAEVHRDDGLHRRVAPPRRPDGRPATLRRSSPRRRSACAGCSRPIRRRASSSRRSATSSSTTTGTRPSATTPPPTTSRPSGRSRSAPRSPAWATTPAGAPPRRSRSRRRWSPILGRRAQLVAAARAWYEAGRAQGGLAPRLPADPYRSTSGRDDMALGAIELRRAGGTAQDTREALAWLDGAEPASPTSWDAVGALAAADLCGRAGARAPSPEAQRAGCAFLRRAAGFSARRARRHSVGTVGVLDFGTTAMHGGAAAVLAMAGERALAADARDWMLGRNPWGASFIAGLGSSPPRRLHHWASPRPDLLRGAVVGGPTTRSVLRERGIAYTANRFDGPGGIYEDRGVDFVTSEAAINYAASAVLLFAALAAR